MKIYNILRRDLQDFVPLHGNVARIYSCGPTVYDHAHIGNLSAYIFADTLRRVVATATGNQPKHVMNYTDVDDKTIRRSQQRYPNLEPKEALSKLTDEYISLFLQDMKRIGNDTSGITFVRATEHIASMKELTQRLYEGDFAYLADDGVYFSIEAYQKSGKTYGQLLDLTAQNTSESRINNDEYDKDNVHDFALWKKQKDNEPAWDFELGGQDMRGRPGWHIECSAMSRDELDQPFDIHTGGVDLIFPHHENEIAQSTALEANPVMAQIFAHNEHILVDGKKMSKSAKNFYTLQDIIDKGYDPLAFRLLVLQAHYRSQVHFSWENLEAAQNRLHKFRKLASLPLRAESKPSQGTDSFLRALTDIQDSLENDLGTPLALMLLQDSLEFWSKRGLSKADNRAFNNFIAEIDKLFGFQLYTYINKDVDAPQGDITDNQKQLIKDREAAREAKDWQKSDDIRDQLIEQGIGLRDTQYGTVWYRL